ncbi:MAG: NAD(P)/FAD-dependent oxidoreductase [Pseudomonadota bacterium]
MTADVDWVVVGAGVVGIAVARRLAQSGSSTLLLEREAAIGTGASSRNSEVLHAGIYYPDGSLKARACVSGRQQLVDFAEARGIPYRLTGKLIVGQGRDELKVLTDLKRRAEANGVVNLEWLTGDQVSALEPQVHCDTALLSPSSGIIDSHQVMVHLLGDFEAAGGLLALRSTVRDLVPASRSGANVRVETDTGPILAHGVVNAAGLGAVDLYRGEPERSPMRLFPCLGHYFRYLGKPPFQRLIYPVPEPGGLGIHATVDLSGAVRFGPDVCWQDDLEYRFDESRREQFARSVARYFPSVDADRLTPDYSGIRAKIVGPGDSAADFTVLGPAVPGRLGVIDLLGIESPGLTSSMALADHVSTLADRWFSPRPSRTGASVP